jgi:zinc D-Ala-D-Ala carboxypeptidase
MQVDKNLKLTPDFALKEFISVLDPKGWEFDIRVLNNLYKLANRLQVVRDTIGKPIQITSGYRSASHNLKVGGEPNSYHTKGMAADIVIRGMSPTQIEKALFNWTGGLGIYTNVADFVHVDIRMSPKGEAIKARWRG